MFNNSTCQLQCLFRGKHANTNNTQPLQTSESCIVQGDCCVLPARFSICAERRVFALPSSTTSPAEDWAVPDGFLATTVYVPASSGYTSLITRDIMLSSSWNCKKSSLGGSNVPSLNHVTLGFGSPEMRHSRRAVLPSGTLCDVSPRRISGSVGSNSTGAPAWGENEAHNR